MCKSNRSITIEKIISESNLTEHIHQGDIEYTHYSSAARYEDENILNKGINQKYFYRAMTALEFEAFLFGSIRQVNGHQGFASFRNYSFPYLRQMLGQKEEDYAVLVELYAPDWINELRNQGWTSGKPESGDSSWGIGKTQSNGWSNPGNIQAKTKNSAKTPLAIFQSTKRTFKIVNLIVKNKTKKNKELAPPSDAPWHGIFKSIDINELENAKPEYIEYIKNSPGFKTSGILTDSNSIDENGIPMDGNCLFHSLSKILRERGVKKITHQDLRKYVCIYMREHADFCSKWGIDKNYITNMNMNGSWGGGIEIAIIAAIYNIKIDVLIFNEGFNSKVTFNQEGNNSPAQLEYRLGTHYTTR